jgi:hypothetical protein
MIKRLFIAAVLVFSAESPLPLCALDRSYDPHWNVGDSWKVRFTVRLYSSPKVAGAALEIPTDILYSYRVVGKKNENGRNVFKVQVKPLEPGWPEWLLTFDADDLTLSSVEKVLSGAVNIKYSNPFGRDAWLAKLGQYNEMVIHDFPKLPNTNTNQNRQLNAGQSSTPVFTQSVQFRGNLARATLQRLDPVSGLTQTTTIEWRRGKKWWSSATTTLGSDVLVSGHLM